MTKKQRNGANEQAMKAERAAAAQTAIEREGRFDNYALNLPGDQEAAIIDMLTNLMHLCHRDDHDFNVLLREARVFFRAKQDWEA